MKTSNTILCSIAGVVLVAAILLAVRLWPQTLRDDECSPLYQRYCHTPGIEASYVKGFPINDTLAIDATLLHATDSASWERLLNDFQTPNSFTEKPTSKAVLFRFAEKGQTKPIIDTNILNNDFLAFSLAEKSITVIHITNEGQVEACIYCQLKQTLKQ